MKAYCESVLFQKNKEKAQWDCTCTLVFLFWEKGGGGGWGWGGGGGGPEAPVRTGAQTVTRRFVIGGHLDLTASNR